MPYIVLIPGILCIVALWRTSPQKAFMNVYLPVFLLLPTYYLWKTAALPPIGFAEATLLPLGIGMIFKDVAHWRIGRSDLWMILFIVSSCYADRAAGNNSVSTFELFTCICTAGIPYMAGKLLIEQYDLRTQTLKRIVFLMFVVGIISAYEYKMGRNPFGLIFDRFFPGQVFGWKTQIRWGFGRVSGPFAQSELAGMMFGFGLVIALYLSYLKMWEPKFSRAPWLPFSKSRIITGVILFTLLMTQARGPWLGCLFAIPIAFIGRSKHILRTAILVFAICGPLAWGSYAAIKHYTSGPVTSDEQQTARYRADLISNYMPVVERGGAFGWGKDFPRVAGQGSIDNEYLYLALTQGYVGLFALCLLAFESFLQLTKPAVFGGVVSYRYFAFTLGGILAGLLLTLTTVFLGNQPYQLFFLLVGWSQSLEPRIGEVKAPVRHFQTIYT